jgi:hypothetical protein
MNLIIDLTESEEAEISAAAKQTGMAPAQLVKKLVKEHLPASPLTPTNTQDSDEDILDAMLNAGLISEIKRPDRAPRTDRPPVPILGKPLSVTIIEERR